MSGGVEMMYSGYIQLLTPALSKSSDIWTCCSPIRLKNTWFSGFVQGAIALPSMQNIRLYVVVVSNLHASI